MISKRGSKPVKSDTALAPSAGEGGSGCFKSARSRRQGELRHFSTRQKLSDYNTRQPPGALRLNGNDPA